MIKLRRNHSKNEITQDIMGYFPNFKEISSLYIIFRIFSFVGDGILSNYKSKYIIFPKGKDLIDSNEKSIKRILTQVLCTLVL